MKDESDGGEAAETFETILSAAVIVLSVYALISQNFMYMPYGMFLLGALMLTMGLTELKEDRNRAGGYLLLILSVFIFCPEEL